MYALKDKTIALIESLSESMSLEWFSLIGGVIEDVFSFVPSPIIMTTAGVLANNQGYTLAALPFLALIGAVGHVVGSMLWYSFAHKVESVALRKRSLFGVSKGDIEGFGNYLERGPWRSGLTLALIRAVPFTPSATVALVCGLVKLNLLIFIPATYIGAAVRNGLLLFLGYSGLEHYDTALSWLDERAAPFHFLVAAGLVVVLIVAFRRYKSGYTNASPPEVT